MVTSNLTMICLSLLLLFGCQQADIPAESGTPQPKEIIDLGALVTEDLTLRVWGKRYAREPGTTAQMFSRYYLGRPVRSKGKFPTTRFSIMADLM